MSYFELDGNSPAENASGSDAGNGSGQEDNHLEEGLTEEDEAFIEEVESKDVDDMTADEREHLKEVLNKAKTTIGQKKHYKTKFEEVSSELERLKPASNQKQTPKGTENKPAPKSDEEKVRYQKLEFRQDHSDLSKDQVEEIFAYAAVKRISPEDAIKTPFIKKFLEQESSDKEVESASGHPASGGAASVKPKGDDYKSMDSKTFAQRRSAILHKNRR